VYASVLHACYMLRQFHPPWFYRPSNIWWRVLRMGLLVLHVSLFSYHLILVKSKYTSKHLPLTWDTKLPTHTEARGEVLGFVWLLHLLCLRTANVMCPAISRRLKLTRYTIWIAEITHCSENMVLLMICLNKHHQECYIFKG
jgi:hypothetical protein